MRGRDQNPADSEQVAQELRPQFNLGRALVHTAKLWVLDLLVANNCTPLVLGLTIASDSKVAKLLEGLNAHLRQTFATTTQEQEFRATFNTNYLLMYPLIPIAQRLAHSKRVEKAYRQNYFAKQELQVFEELKKLVADRTAEDDKKIFFLLCYYEKLNALDKTFTPESEDPKTEIVNELRLLMMDDLIAYKIENLSPEQLNQRLVKRRKQFNDKIRERALAEEEAAKKAAEEEKAAVNSAPIRPLREDPTEGITQTTLTLEKYKTACAQYEKDLTTELYREINKHFRRSPQAGFFTLKLFENLGTSDQITDKLVAQYFSKPAERSTAEEKSPATKSGFANSLRGGLASVGRVFSSFIQSDANSTPTSQETLDAQISRLRHPWYALLDKDEALEELWERLKLIKKLSKTATIQEFHHLLAQPQNKAILTARCDSAFMTFVKMCGVVVASILGLPLFIVGGAYLSYRGFFGSRATKGRVFLRDIDKITEQARDNFEAKGCCRP